MVLVLNCIASHPSSSYPNGTINWSFDLGEGDTGHTSPALSADGTIYFSTDEGKELIALNSDGTEKWRKKITAKWCDSSPIIAKDGTVYVGSAFQEIIDRYGTAIDGGYIHAFGPVESNQPPEIPTISGEINGRVRIPHYYKFVSHDPDNNPIAYFVDWGDGEKEWSNEYASDQPGYVSHYYLLRGTYVIKAKARDSLGAESDWGTLTVTMPKNKQLINLEPGIYVDNAQKMPFPIPIIVGSIDIKVQASDTESGMNMVEFYIDNELKLTVTEKPYIWKWDEFSFGRHILKVIAYDNAGNSDTDEMKVWKFF